MSKAAFALVCALVIAPASFASNDSEPRFWRASQVTLQAGVGGGASPKVLREVLRASAAVWNHVGTGPELFIEERIVHVRGPELDGVNAVFFVEGHWPWNPNELALTFSHRRAGSREVVEVDIAINAVHHRFGDEPGSFDLQNVITHELGHALGLRHLDEEPEATMYPSIAPGEQKKRDLAASDENALLTLYEALEMSDAPTAARRQGEAYTGPCSRARCSRSPCRGRSVVVVERWRRAHWRLRARLRPRLTPRLCTSQPRPLSSSTPPGEAVSARRVAPSARTLRVRE